MKDNRTKDFRTFCHISEYVSENRDFASDDGYQNLHRMIAVSNPLNLWSPSSFFLRRTNCRVSPKDFVALVEKGHVRVLGRRNWIENIDGFRDTHPWPGAKWDSYVDGAIRSIHRAEEGAGIPRSERRVVAVETEQGYSAALELISDEPEYVPRLVEAFRDKGSDQIPIGTREAVARDLQSGKHGDVPAEAAIAMTILRDAHNHGAALQEAEAQVPFLLSSHDAAFVRLLGELTTAGHPGDIFTDVLGDSPDSPRTAEDLAQQADLARQLVELLKTMDVLRRKKVVRPSWRITSWVGSEGHQLLVAWFRTVSEQASCRTGGEADKLLARTLAEQIQHSQLEARWPALLGGRTLGALGLLGLLEGAVKLALDPTDIIGIAELGTSAAPVGFGLLQKCGWVRAGYTGTQWPYLYAFGREASGRRREDLERALRDASC